MGNTEFKGQTRESYLTSHSHQWIDLFNSKIKTIPQEVYDLQPEGLCLAMNPISLNDNLGKKLQCLHFLDLSQCNLMVLPNCIIQLTQLEELVVSRNALAILPALPESIEKLDLSYNVIVHLPEQLSQLPKLFHVSIEGNPCEKLVRHQILKGRAKGGKFLGKKFANERLRFTQEELDALCNTFESIADENHVLDELHFENRLGLLNVPDMIFSECLFRSFEKGSSARGQIDIRSFLLTMGILFKGTVDETLRFVFNLYDRDADGFLELQDLLDVSRSSLISAVYLADHFRKKYESSSGVEVKMKAFDFTLRTNGRYLTNSTTSVIPETDSMIREVLSTIWPFLKEVLIKRFKQMDINGKGKVSLQDFSRYQFSKFPEVKKFLSFYSEILRYGCEVCL